MPSDSAPAPLAGQRLGPYVLREQLGAGGMGEVYRARDDRLGRDVAIKLLPPHLAAYGDRRERFEREARLLAALNHPHIASVYGLEEGIVSGRPISGIVLELVEGGTLAERLRRGALPRAEAVRAARQIAQALDAAHDRGIIHRDLKPANVALTPEGDVKILDFGVGRWAAPPGEPSQDATVTEPGLVLGTAGYMSPEQARGSVVDKRTDIWAFGCVLYEMLTGRAPFAAATVPDTLAAVLYGDPDWTALPAGTPVTLCRLLRRCLEKDPKRRLRDIGDAVLEPEDASAHPPAPDPMARPADSRPRALWPVASALAVAVAAWLLWPAPAPPNPLAGATFTRLTDWDGSERQASLSRDGQMVAFLSDRDGTWDAWTGQIGTGVFQNLTKGAAPELLNPAVRNVGFTPDGALITLWVRLTDPERGVTTDGWAVPVLGGRLRPYMDRYSANIADIQWSPDRQQLVYHTSAAGDPLFVTSREEGAGRQIYVAEPGLHNHFPTWSPDGAFIYFVHGFAPDEMDLWRIRPSGGEPERLTFHDSRVAFPAFVSRRHLLYLATAPDGSGPWIHALDVARQVSERLNTGVDEYTSLEASEDGRRLVATNSRVTAGVWRAPLSSGVLDESGVTRLSLPTAKSGSPRAGQGFLLYRSLTAGAESLWRRADDGEAVELWHGRDGRVLSGAAVSPNGQQVAFPVQRRGAARLYIINADGSGVRRLSDELDVRGSPAWSPDGDWIATAAIVDGQPFLFKIPLDGGPAQLLVRDYARDPAWAPSGGFIVYSGADVGMTFPVRAVSEDGRPHPLPNLELSRGGRRLAFLDDGRSLVVLRGDLTHKEIWVVDLETGRERRLTRFGPGFTISDFDVTPDGQHIIFDRVRDDSDIVLIERP
jgi:Tol biopolymer transport system component